MRSLFPLAFAAGILLIATACFPRYGEEWVVPTATGRVLVAAGPAPLEGAAVSYLAAPDDRVFTDADGRYRVPGVVERGLSVTLPASGVAWRPLKIEAAGYPGVIIQVRAPLPAHRDIDVHVPPLLLAQPAALTDVHTATPADCDRVTWQNAMTLWAMARTAGRATDNETLIAGAYGHAGHALDAAYRDCADESPWTGRLRINELRQLLESESARYR